MKNTINFIVEEKSDKKRSDIYIFNKCPEISRTRIKNLILDKRLKINGKIKYLIFGSPRGLKNIWITKAIIAIESFIAKSFELAPKATVLTTSSLYNMDSPKPRKILIAGIIAPME